MRSRRATPPHPPAPCPPDDGYLSLSVAEVLADLPSLDSEQLQLVKSLEEAGHRRPVILDRIDDLLVVQEAAHHVGVTTPPTRTPRPVLRPVPPLADKALADELLDQMGSLLAKDSARRSASVPAAQTPPSPAPATRGKGAPEAHVGVIVPTDGRRSRGGRGRRLVIPLVIVALLAGAGALAWSRAHTTSTAAPAAALTVSDVLAARLIKAAPAGYIAQADAVGHTGPSDLAKAAQDDGAPDAHDVLVQDGFLHGYQRLWVTADQQGQLLVTLYHFRTPEGASAYSQRMAAVASANAKAPAADLALAGIPKAVGLSAADGATQSAEALFTRGIYSVTIVAHGTVAPSVQSVVQQVAAAQYALLPPG